MRTYGLQWALIVLSVVALVGCNPVEEATPEADNNPDSTLLEEISQEEILAMDHILAILIQEEITLVSPQQQEFLAVKKIERNMLPARSRLHDIKLSSDKQHIVWYTPIEGLLVLHLDEDSEIKQLSEPNEWLNTDPFFVISDDSNEVFFLVNDGNTLRKVNMHSGERQEFAIPYPYGTVFRLSPSGNTALFISDLRQDDPERPAYLLMNLDAGNYTGISLDIDIADRYLVEWAEEDGFMAAKDTELWYVPTSDPINRRMIFEITGKQILRIERIEDDMYVFDDEGYWHIYSIEENREVGRTPVSIAEELRSPSFYPWYDRSFLISEVAGDDQEKYLRLWWSDLRGNKTLVVPNFGRVNLENEIPVP